MYLRRIELERVASDWMRWLLEVSCTLSEASCAYNTEKPCESPRNALPTASTAFEPTEPISYHVLYVGLLLTSGQLKELISYISACLNCQVSHFFCFVFFEEFADTRLQFS